MKELGRKTSNEGKIADLSRSAAGILLRLKAHNRKLYRACQRKKALVESAKSSLDVHSLQLQNLKYEKDYLKREIEKCKMFEAPELRKIGFDEVSEQDHKDTWKGFTKLVTWGTLAVIAILVILALTLL